MVLGTAKILQHRLWTCPLSFYCKIAMYVCFVPMNTCLCHVLYVIDRMLLWYCVNNYGAVWPNLT